MATKTVSFPKWPTWNFHFPEQDVKRIVAVKYYPAPLEQLALPNPDGSDPRPQQLDYDLDKVRLATGRSGVSGIVFKEKCNLPAAAARDDAVSIEYEV